MEQNQNDLLAKLSSKILKVSQEIGKMEKDGENKFSNYKFISSEQMLTGNRTAFPKHGIAIIPSVVGSNERDFTNSKGGITVRTTVQMEFLIVDTETGFSITLKWQGADQDTGGKSFGQAVTECCKRFYFKLFNISSQGEVDPDSKTTPVDGNGKPDFEMEEMEKACPKVQGQTNKENMIERIKYLSKCLGIQGKDFKEKVKDIDSLGAETPEQLTEIYTVLWMKHKFGTTIKKIKVPVK